ncbi:MAG: hypothetical protein EXR72_09305 [Myxococcales bacterium]|nr:hypothetical protein [Myxococcales bacterium]
MKTPAGPHPPATIDQCLREMSRLSEGIDSRTPRVDMGAAAIDLRLRQLSDLTAACLELGRIGARRDDLSYNASR